MRLPLFYFLLALWLFGCAMAGAGLANLASKRGAGRGDQLGVWLGTVGVGASGGLVVFGRARKRKRV